MAAQGPSKASSGVVKAVTDGGSVATVAEVTGFTMSRSASTLETTQMSDSARTYVAGLTEGTCDIDVHWDPNDTAQDDLKPGQTVDVEIYPENASGNEYYTFGGIVTGYNITSSTDSIVSASISIQIDGAVTEANVV